MINAIHLMNAIHYTSVSRNLNNLLFNLHFFTDASFCLEMALTKFTEVTVFRGLNTNHMPISTKKIGNKLLSSRN